MNKYTTFMILVIYLVFVTFLIEASGVAVIENSIDSGLTTASEAETSAVFGMLGSFFKLVTFRVGEGMPEWFIMIFVFPVVAVFWYMVIDVIKDLIPFT